MISVFRRRMESYAAVCPCAWILAGVLNASAALIFRDSPSCGEIFLAAVPGVLIVWFLLGTKNALFRFALPSLLAALSLCWTFREMNAAFQPESRYWNSPVGIQVRVELTDSALTNGELAFLHSFPFLVKGRVRTFRYGPQERWLPADASVFLRLPVKGFEKVGAGDKLELTGRLFPIEDDSLPGRFSLRNYAAVRGIRYRFETDSGRILPEERNWNPTRFFSSLRGKILKRLTADMRRDESKTLASSLFFGIKQGLSPETKEIFLKSGTIHMLCVSGLHIGLFFSVFSILFLLLPFRIRNLAVIVPVLIYALSTGMQSPAARAFLMFCVWCVLNAFLLRTSVLNTILFAASVLLIGNPLLVLDWGFRYSFLCVFFLICAVRLIRLFSEALNSARKFHLNTSAEREKIPWTGRLRNRIACAAAAGLVAWVASAAVSLCAQGLFTPGAVPAFLLMSIPSWICFSLFGAGIVLLPFPGLTEWCGRGMEVFLLMLERIAACFSGEAFYSVSPPGWTVFLFCGILLVILSARSRRVWIGACLLLLSGWVLLFSLRCFRSPELVILSGNGQLPTVLLMTPSEGTGTVVNLPDYHAAQQAAACLQHSGIRQVNVIFTSSGVSACGGGSIFLRIFPVRRITFLRNVSSRTPTAGKVLSLAETLRIPADRKKDPSFDSEIHPRSRCIFFWKQGAWNGLLLHFSEERISLEHRKRLLLEHRIRNGPGRSYCRYRLNELISPAPAE